MDNLYSWIIKFGIFIRIGFILLAKRNMLDVWSYNQKEKKPSRNKTKMCSSRLNKEEDV